MKSTGIVRKVDDLGRVVIPVELRRSLEIAVGDSLEIFKDDNKIILRKYKPDHVCIVTGQITDSNYALANGKVVVSPEGMEILRKAIEENFLVPAN
ncbi:AbrB/MazE/SpoVT family DNA-binding domain-containing protein [Neobacillus notoginsengisoli]|uniref:AbrB/MazE/SpoVT family DNA-binding domain-containing protein n=1 Tax=Neobacillus notoginsengisoli TaxID=1578198 RepID=A0A417YPM6_9BACI|nr:AbrB/MazE/SpoVT family DNA-binding domain-containing protein [Neobacillus notoginsengisoli]RHW35945.1 AbrB/MazE/SpoVT family DNA-binding domain-containing protein [Neobacillus notoginsengisoli]